jgi:hypothetical protein
VVVGGGGGGVGVGVGGVKCKKEIDTVMVENTN